MPKTEFTHKEFGLGFTYDPNFENFRPEDSVQHLRLIQLTNPEKRDAAGSRAESDIGLMFQGMPNPELGGLMRRLRWFLGLSVYDWTRERWAWRYEEVERKKVA